MNTILTDDDRQRVPEDWKMVQAALRFYADASDYKAPFTGGMGKLWFDCGTVARSALDRIDAMLDAAPEAPAQAVSEREAFPANLTVEHIDRFEAAISDLGPATVQAAAWVCELARAALTKQPAAQAIAADDLHTEAIAEGFESVADYVAYLKKSKDTYFAERNSARDAARRNREAPAQASAVELTVESIRAAGGIVHSDGNIFFTNIEQARAALAQKVQA